GAVRYGRGRQCGRPSFGESAGPQWVAVRLDADDLNRWLQPLDSAGNSGDEPPAPDCDDDPLDAGKILGDLQTDPTVAGLNGRVGERVYERLGLGLPCVLRHPCQELWARHENGLTTELTDALDLRCGRAIKHYDSAGHTQPAGHISTGNGGVAGAHCDQDRKSVGEGKRG